MWLDKIDKDQKPALPFVRLLTLGRFLILSEYELPLLENGEITYLIKLFRNEE